MKKKEEMGAEGIKWMVMGIKLDFMSPDSVMIICFDKADDAKAFTEAMEGEDEEIDEASSINFDNNIVSSNSIY